MLLLHSHWQCAYRCYHSSARRPLKVQSRKGFGQEAETAKSRSRQGDQARKERKETLRSQGKPQRTDLQERPSPRPDADREDPDFDNRLASLRSQSESRPKAPQQFNEAPLGGNSSASSTPADASSSRGRPGSIYDNPPPVGQTLFGIKEKSDKEKQEGGGGFGTNQIAVSIGSLILGIIILLATGVTDIFPGSAPRSKGGPAPNSQERPLDEGQKAELEKQAEQYEERLKKDDKDAAALEGGGATYAVLGSYDKAVALLTRLTQTRPEESSSWRLLAEVKADQQDWRGSEAAYERAMAESKELSLDLLQGLTGVLAADSRPERAVDVIRGAEKSVSKRSGAARGPQSSATGESSTAAPEFEVNQAELDLLLGKVYSGWRGHVGDAYDVYDKLIKREPNDFRGHLAKGAVYKSQGRKSDAQRSFIQARYLAPANLKPLVEKLSAM
ncbi:hypothetical protein WJX74_009651 [Apatococcus lobatus]|uniref:Uncharacterized protein n=1 Tax=Apatococcus lobatus TaxID=904363 RepID=A0AAW1QCV4_9CHLO